MARGGTMTEEHLDVAYSRYLLATDYERRLEQHERRILVGSVCRRLVRPLANRWTHQFRVDVRTEEEAAEPLADYVQKVVFRFSGDCVNCIEIVDRPPFQTSSYCCRASMVTLTLLFRDADHTCTIFHHPVGLPGEDSLGRELPCAMQDTAHTIIFVNPSRKMMQLLRLPVLEEMQDDHGTQPDLGEHAEYQGDEVAAPPEQEDEQQILVPSSMAREHLRMELNRARRSIVQERRYLVNPWPCDF